MPAPIGSLDVKKFPGPVNISPLQPDGLPRSYPGIDLPPSDRSEMLLPFPRCEGQATLV